jgi:hypothetical protein
LVDNIFRRNNRTAKPFSTTPQVLNLKQYMGISFCANGASCITTGYRSIALERITDIELNQSAP